MDQENEKRRGPRGFGEIDDPGKDNPEGEEAWDQLVTGRGAGAVDAPKVRTRIKIKDIIDPKPDRDIDPDYGSWLAESLLVQGQIYPILVRAVELKQNNRVRRVTVLVDGAYRIAATTLRNQEYIDVMYIEGHDIDAELAEIGANFFRQRTVLERAEQLVRWMVLALAKLKFSGHVGQKGPTGRPVGGIAMAARELPLIGRSVEARRKIIGHATKIDRISPEGKQAARENHLDNNQKALLEIARAGNPKAQVRKAAKLAGRAPADTDQATRRPDKANLKKSPPLHSPSDEGEDDEASESEDEAEKPAAPYRETTLDDLEAFWSKEGDKLWAYAPGIVRQGFFDKLQRARCKAKVDIAAFIDAAFKGREKIACEALYRVARKRNVAKATLRTTLRALGYPRKRDGYWSGSRWYFVNKNRLWKSELPAIPESEFDAATEEIREESKSSWKLKQHQVSDPDDDYYDLGDD